MTGEFEPRLRVDGERSGVPDVDPSMAATFYLKCMGMPELRAPNGRVVRMRGRKHLALLVYLAVERRAQYPRDELAHLLWAGASMAEARHSLATGASAIRRALGPGALEGNREVLRLRHSLLRLDLDRLETGELFPTPELPPIEVDTFLHGFEVRDAHEYMLWQDRQHARWLPAIHAALLRLIDHGRRTGASRVIGRLADRLLTIDELSEDGIRAKMEALAFAGDRIAALRVFEEWRERLQVELEAVPSPLVEEMARRLRRRGLERPVADTAPSVQTDPWRDRPFVGRANEYRHLYESWESTGRQVPRHVLVEGESGIGKSTLVERFSTAAALEGAIVSRVQCYELERAIPFAAIAGLVTRLIDKPGASSTEPAALAEVARVVPGVRERFPGLPAPRESQGETARLHFAEGVLALLEAAMEEHPVVLVVDDFHLADEVSLTVLHLLIRRLEGVRLMVVLTMRTSELGADSGAARIHSGGEYLRMTHLLLPPLSDEESSELLSGLIPGDRDAPTPPERHILLQAARGVPMVLQLLVQDWQRHGRESLALSVRSMKEHLADLEHLSGTHRAILDRVLRDLSAPTHFVLSIAAILGSRLNDLTLYGLADLSISQTLMGMGELTRCNILRDSPSGLDFTNEIVRGYAYSRMPTTLRRAVHAAVADALLARLASEHESERGLETAWHLVRGGRSAEAATHLLRGARDAIKEGAPHEAELALISALQTSNILGIFERNEATLLLAELQQEQSRWSESSLSLLELRQPLPPAQSERASLLTIIARRHTEHLGGAYLAGVITSLIDLSQTASTTSVRVRALAVASGILDQTQGTDFVDALWEEARRLHKVRLQPEEEADLLTAQALLLYHARQTAESLSSVNRAITLLEASGTSNAVFANLVLGLSALACSEGRYTDAAELGRRAFTLATRLDNERIALRASGNVSLALGRLGDYSQQLEWAERRASYLRKGAFDQERILTGLFISSAKAMQRDPSAIDDLNQMVESLSGDPVPWVQQSAELLFADANKLLGRQGTAVACARRATEGSNQKLHSISFAGRWARWVAHLHQLDSPDSEQEPRIEELVANLQRYDVIDRVEILCAFLATNRTNAKRRRFLADEARSLLSRLPPPVADQLELLGSLAPLIAAKD